MRLRKLIKLQRGDTIIEVLLAMTVIGLVLGSSYAIANRSLSIGRDAQERTEALKEVETQFERLRTVSATSDNELVDFPTTSAFCIDETLEVVDFDRPNFESFVETTIDEVEYPEGDDDSFPCNTGFDGRYGMTVTRSDRTIIEPSVEDSYLFTIRARWESFSGGPLKELQTQYRVYPVGNTAYESFAPPAAPDSAELPTSSITISDETASQATLSILFSSEGRSAIESAGYYISTEPIPDNPSGLSPITISLGSSFPQTVTATETGLAIETQYYVRAFARNDAGLSLSAQQSFTTLGPLQIAGFDIENLGIVSATIRTNVEGDADSYRLEIQDSVNSVTTNHSSRDGVFRLSGFAPATDYSFSVTATGPEGSATSGGSLTTQSPSGMTRAGEYNGSVYYLSTSTATWPAAAAFARENEGFLVTINDQEENAEVASYTNGSWTWIGLTDQSEEEDFRWHSRESSSYRNFLPPQPDNWTDGGIQDGEDYVHINFSEFGKWNDLNASRSLSFIVEYKVAIDTFNLSTTIPVAPPITYQGNQYYISDQPYTWEEANAFAQDSGGYLVTISSAAENRRVADLAAGRHVWIGITDRAEEDTWVWENGEPVSYDNWAPNEPNDHLNGVPGEDVAVLNWSGGQWNDWYNDDSTRAFFVIEYEE